MTLQNPKPGPGFIPAFQIPGIPYLTSSIVPATTVVGIDLPNVTRDFRVKNAGSSELRVGVSDQGVRGQNYYSLTAAESQLFEYRTRTVFIYNPGGAPVAFSFAAGLSAVDAKDFPLLTGSNGFIGV